MKLVLASQSPRRKELLGRLAELAGFHPSGEPASAEELLGEFSWERIPREDIRLPAGLFE